MVSIRIETNADQVARQWDYLARREGLFAIALSTTRTAKDVRDDALSDIKDRALRKRLFLRVAPKSTLTAVVQYKNVKPLKIPPTYTWRGRTKHRAISGEYLGLGKSIKVGEVRQALQTNAFVAETPAFGKAILQRRTRDRTKLTRMATLVERPDNDLKSIAQAMVAPSFARHFPVAMEDAVRTSKARG